MTQIIILIAIKQIEIWQAAFRNNTIQQKLNPEECESK